MSTGNSPIEIQLDTAKITLVRGKNGNGKGGIAAAIFYALYGKAFSKVNLSSLINSINKKGLLVELELSINGTKYLIRRGMKPNIFEIWVNGVLKPQTANVKDYQKWFMDDVLHMDERTFRQVITMGSSSFVPFMRLSAADRRTIIEDLLSIDIISQMNGIAKYRNKLLEKSKSEIEHHLFQVQTKLDSIKSLISSNSTLEKIDIQLQKLKDQSKVLLERIESLQSRNNPEKYKRLSNLNRNILDLLTDGQKILFKKQHIRNELQDKFKFFQERFICPTCTQALTKEFISTKQMELSEGISFENSEISELESKLQDLQNQAKSIQKSMDHLHKIQMDLSKEIQELSYLRKSIEFYVAERESFLSKQAVDNKNILDLESSVSELTDQLQEIQKKLDGYEIIFKLLRDDGIRTVIIKKYLGVINSLIKKYLNLINFNVSFTFDTDFTETIKSRGRDIFEYNCFSEGERMRIDFCLLFAFRELARLRSTVNTNLLIIDEQDGRLDTEGINAINSLLTTIDGSVFIISQYAEHYEEIAQNQILMEKTNHFTHAILV